MVNMDRIALTSHCSLLPQLGLSNSFLDRNIVGIVKSSSRSILGWILIEKLSSHHQGLVCIGLLSLDNQIKVVSLTAHCRTV
jgi:hypothetical protein